MDDVISHTTPELKDAPGKSDPTRAGRMLNFNFAIVATRTMDKVLMMTLSPPARNLPEDCPQFFKKG